MNCRIEFLNSVKKRTMYALKHSWQKKLFQELIAAGQDINERMPGSLQSPLMAACLGGHLVAAETLLELDADVSVPEKDGYTPMHGAGFQGRAEIGRDF
jgi:ankyrin repeat protein